jgi:hypothetical protein
VPADFVTVAVAVDDELVLEVVVAAVNEVVVEAVVAEFVTVVLTGTVAVAVPVVVADTAFGPAYLVQKPNASLLLAVSRENRYG